MIKSYRLTAGMLAPVAFAEGRIHHYATPDGEERRGLREHFQVDDHSQHSALDPDEVSRMEVHPDHLLLIWKRPKNFSGKEVLQFDVASLGLVLRDDQLVIITSEDFPLEGVGSRHSHPALSTLDVLLNILSGSIHHFLGHIKVIKMIAREIQEHINRSMENQHLIQMFSLSESLIFYINAISMNGIVLERLRNHFLKQKVSHETMAFIDDLIIENNQCFKQAEIYSSVLSGLMDARGNIVNNNMNILLRNLTIITVIFSPLNLIAGIGGMSEFSMMTQGIDWRISYGFLTLALIGIGWITNEIIKRMATSARSDDAPSRRHRKRR